MINHTTHSPGGGNCSGLAWQYHCPRSSTCVGVNAFMTASLVDSGSMASQVMMDLLNGILKMIIYLVSHV
jgi:hypothetical protein